MEQSGLCDEICEELGETSVMRTLVLRKASGALTSRHHAIAIVTRYRILWVKRSSKGVYKSESLLELTSITMVDSGKVLYFRFAIVCQSSSSSSSSSSS
jgi:hypothetical protein